jgi:hypothetical protein
MTTRTFAALWAISSFFLSGAALAQQQSGNTSGPAVGKNVLPSTVVEKQYEGRSNTSEQDKQLGASSRAAGSPGIEGKPGAQSGQGREHRAPGS